MLTRLLISYSPNCTILVMNATERNHNSRRVGIVLFDEVEVLDFCGPFEVFAATGGRRGSMPFKVFTVSEERRSIKTRGGLTVNPDFDFEACPQPEILIVPGGIGTRREMNNERMLAWLRRQAESAELVLSVCSGALVLANAGLLDGLRATTHHGAIGELQTLGSEITIDAQSRFIDNGKVIVSAGIAAGIDMSLHVVERLLGKEDALETATYMEYNWDCDLCRT